MKVKTSITLSEGVLGAVDELLDEFRNRSEAIEYAIRFFLEERSRKRRAVRDLQILNRCAERLNEEAEDVLTYQVDL